MGGQRDIGNNQHIQGSGAPRGPPGRRADLLRGRPAARRRFLQPIEGISAIANSHVFTANAHYVFANLRTWGWITLIIGALQLVAAVGIVTGNQLARWFAVAVVGLNAIDMMFFIPAYPFWALVIIAVDVVALYALCVYGSRENLAV